MKKDKWRHKRKDRKDSFLTAKDYYDFVCACYTNVESTNVSKYTNDLKQKVEDLTPKLDDMPSQK